MKKIASIIIVICGFLLIGYVLLSKDHSNVQGSGTLEDPYIVEDSTTIQEAFLKCYQKDLMKQSDTLFDEATDLVWKRTSKEEEIKDIIIDDIQYFGKEKIADLMIMVSSNKIDKELSVFLDENFSKNETMVTTSKYRMNFEFTTGNNNMSNRTPFALRLADEVLDNSDMMIVSYRIKIDEKWYQAQTMIIDHFDKLYIPNSFYDKGRIY